ncbi:class I SAM-dependent methyltransferase [Streptomyces cavernae]|uniref:class I SAM-dependent methyltransferase n=1 Tax=Streptomyces cavernae TaxID=2259034 RepID=UPI000FEB9532|nr:class I SAM-dependent methyltransferase [Streptomyces cavernae]
MTVRTPEPLYAPLSLEQGLHLLDSLTWFPTADADERWEQVADYVGRNVTVAPRPAPEHCRTVAERVIQSVSLPGQSGARDLEGRWLDVPDAKSLYQAKYDLMTALYPDDWFIFMNMGHRKTGAAVDIQLPPEQRVWQYAAQLYDLIASQVPLKGTDVLEVGSGRGGGAALVARTHRPRTLVGLDYSPANVAFCSRVHQYDGLSFVHGDAEQLPFADASFDAVVNIESAHCYPHVDRFFAEARRVLRPGGHLLFADEWWTSELPQLRKKVTDAGLRVLEEEDITPGIIHALEGLPEHVSELLKEMPEGPRKNAYTRFFHERVCRESAHSYISGRFVFMRLLAVRDN